MLSTARRWRRLWCASSRGVIHGLTTAPGGVPRRRHALRRLRGHPPRVDPHEARQHLCVRQEPGQLGQRRVLPVRGRRRGAATSRAGGRRRARSWSGVSGSDAHSSVGRPRRALIWDRRRLASRRRRCEPRVRFVGRRGGGGGARASRSTVAMRSRAAARLRCCDRCSAASTVRTVPVSRGPSPSSARSRWRGVRAVVVARSNESCTRESVVLTPCPPGPLARLNCSDSSWPGITSPSGIPGPGGTRSSFTSSGCHPRVSATSSEGGEFSVCAMTQYRSVSVSS